MRKGMIPYLSCLVSDLETQDRMTLSENFNSPIMHIEHNRNSLTCAAVFVPCQPQVRVLIT